MAAPMTRYPADSRSLFFDVIPRAHLLPQVPDTPRERERGGTGFHQVFFSHTHHHHILRTRLESTTGPLIMQCPQSPGRLLSEEQFSCSICLEVFVDPVSTPCGHTFCMACLQGFWNHSKKFICPMCKKTFAKKPELSVNFVLAEIAQQFQGLSTANLPAAPKEDNSGDFAKSGDVPCDACIGRKMKAVKSCLKCPGSFCEAHLRPHKKGKALSGHKLVDPIRNLEDKMCKKHVRLLDAYCRNEHACVCKECAETLHKTHNVVSVDREWKKVASQLGKKRSELKHLIKEREKKLEEMKHSIKVLKESSQREMEESWAVYGELQRLLEQSQAELLDIITAKQKQAEQQSRDLANGLEQELDALRRRSSELDALAETHDRVMFLQLLPSLPPAPEPSDWSAVSVSTDLHISTIRKSVCSLVDKLQQEVKRLYGKELRKLQNYASEVIMDPSTAQRDLCLSEDGRQVRYEEQRKSSSHSDTPRRFSPALFVLGREGLSAGRHYWEVEVGHKTAWTLGVARGSVRRKGEIRLSPDGGFWCLWLKNGEVKALSGNRVPVHLTSLPQKMGIFLDYEAGQVSFYDARARSHLYTFNDTFTESLYPIFSPCINQDGKNPGPLIISAVKHS